MRQIAGVYLTGIFLVLAGCASSWQVTQQSYANAEYRIQTPPQWMIITKGTTTVLSRHGPLLESIRIHSHALEDTLPHTRIRIHPDMLPHEIGEALLYAMIADPNKSYVSLAEQSLRKIDGRRAVRMRFDYMVNDISCSDLVYAFIQEPELYQLRYSAATRHYYDKSLDEFEQLVNSFRMK